MSHLLNETQNIDISLANQMSILTTIAYWRHHVVNRAHERDFSRNFSTCSSWIVSF